jgi:hypothetical protein
MLWYSWLGTFFSKLETEVNAWGVSRARLRCQSAFRSFADRQTWSTNHCTSVPCVALACTSGESEACGWFLCYINQTFSWLVHAVCKRPEVMACDFHPFDLFTLVDHAHLLPPWLSHVNLTWCPCSTIATGPTILTDDLFYRRRITKKKKALTPSTFVCFFQNKFDISSSIRIILRYCVMSSTKHSRSAIMSLHCKR